MKESLTAGEPLTELHAGYLTRGPRTHPSHLPHHLQVRQMLHQTTHHYFDVEVIQSFDVQRLATKLGVLQMDLLPVAH